MSEIAEYNSCHLQEWSGRPVRVNVRAVQIALESVRGLV